ncbi:hypothetical protein HZH66_009828 [Vespula vulgaris]|uniref:Uncharacterized protein n=1 Tax=Vespula vulgaris TaxID=7454 RepID=A0A834JM16_VESVU|nr:hypothetical protein HZH66_009828 [Vespula vulgaris]
MERIRRYLERAGVDVGIRPSANVELDGVARFSDTKSIGSLSQHLFESDEDERYYGTCNGYASQPGSKSNLLLCSECDQKTRTCTYRPQTPGSYVGRYVEERLDPGEEFAFLRADYKTPVRTSPSPRSSRDPQDTSSSPRPRDLERHFQDSSSPRSLRQEQELLSCEYLGREGTLEETEKHRKQETEEDEEEEEEEEEEDSPVCELCHGNGLVLVHCEHCDFSTEGDLICFRCQSDEGSSNGNNGCPRCERSARMAAAGVASSDEENHHPPGKYPVDAVVKIKLNDRTIDVDSDDTNDSDPSIDRHRGQVDRLDTIVETKGDTASENDDDNGGAKLNGTTSPRYLNYMIVLFL